jgi:hypothetical protein
MERLLPTDYFHVVFTVPDELLNGIILRNRELFFNLLFAAASETLLALGQDPKQLGGQLGVTAVLHTWTRDLRFHAHLHCIVTGGGLSEKGRWVAAQQDYLFPVKVLSRLFRGKLLTALEAAFRAGKLNLSGACASLCDPLEFARRKDQLYKKEWVAYAKKPFAGPEQVYRYLGRYTHRVGISNQRLLAMTHDGVLFRTRGEGTALLSHEDFIGRFLQHVLPPRFVKIRHYGLHAPANATTKLEIARQAIEKERRTVISSAAAVATALVLVTYRPDPKPAEDWRALLLRLTGVDPSRCPRCGIGTLTRTPLSLPPNKPPDSS